MKSSKKALALALAAAMVVTAVPATNANAATTGLSAKKATVYVGGSKTLTVKTPKSWKSVKVTASTSNKKVAKVKKTSAKKVKVTAVKAGTAKVKVKVTYKKSTKKNAKKYTKTYTCKTTVKTPTIKLNQTKVTLNVGDTTPVKVTKKTPSSITVKYSSEDPAIASVAKGTITAVSAGTTNIVVKAKYGTKTITKKVKVTVAAAKDGLTPVLTNQLSATDYPNTVLVSDPAIIKVTYAKDGKPVAGQTLVISNNNEVPGTDAYRDYYFENTAATTNASGVATFIIKNTYRDVKASDEDEVASVNYRIQLADNSADTGTAAVTGTANFASISVSDVWNVNNKDKDDKNNLVPGTNFKAANPLSTRAYETNTTQTLKYSDYVLSQQVSKEGDDAHKVIMDGGYPVIKLPGTASDAKTTKDSMEINYSSGEYKTYVDTTKSWKLDKDPKKLSYATLNFDKVSLSKYTCMTVATYDNETKLNDDIKNGTVGTNAVDSYTYNGEMTQGVFGYQIPIDKVNGSGIWVAVRLQSKGQVQDGKNSGYTAKNIDYVYKSPQASGITWQPYKGGTVTWKQVETKYTAETAVKSAADVNNAVLPNGYNFDKYNYTVKLPVFPYTGNAVITESDKNGKVVAYYAVETVNKARTVTSGSSIYCNQNEVKRAARAYQISADEVKDTTGTISQEGTKLTMNATKAGRMTMEGIVTIDGKEYPEADLAHVYTSVQWNPIPNATVANTKNYVALLGQKIEVIAQLTDMNHNAVSQSNETIDFYAGSNKIVENGTVAGINGKNATAVALKGVTDTQGQAKLTLKATDITTIKNITAKAGSNKYNVDLRIAKDTNVTSADLYWVDADLGFDDQVGKGLVTRTARTTTVAPAVTTSGSALDVKPEAGTTWNYGVYTIGTYQKDATHTDKITINGIDATITKTPESVGQVSDIKEGNVKATSTKAGEMDIVSKLDASSGTSNATVVKDGFVFAGTGAPTINKKLTINVNWTTKGITASYVVPTGTNITGNDTVVYVKVQDNLGNAVAGRKVTFGVDANAKLDASAKSKNAIIGTTTTTGSAVTNKNGIAQLKLTKTGALNSTTTVSCKVDGVDDQTFDQTFRWVANGSPVAINDKKNADTNEYVTRFDRDKKTVTLVFKDDVVTASVVKELFKVEIGNTTKTEYAVKSAVANGNVVTLTLADVPTTIAKGDQVLVTISNNVTPANDDDIAYTLTYTNGTKNASSIIVTIDANNLSAPY